jgi:septal ring factor EnvC (AmiA/AmiB activator)
VERNEAIAATLSQLRADLQANEIETRQLMTRVSKLQSESNELKQLIAGLEARVSRPEHPAEQARITDEGIVAFSDHVGVAATPAAPITSVAIKRILSESADPLNVGEITDEIRRRGWDTGQATNLKASVRQSIQRMVNKTKELQRADRGKYRIASDSTNEPERPVAQHPNAVLASSSPPAPSHP